ncbi:hypothetical protein NW813_02495 [Synechococcus sp. R55.6]
MILLEKGNQTIDTLLVLQLKGGSFQLPLKLAAKIILEINSMGLCRFDGGIPANQQAQTGELIKSSLQFDPSLDTEEAGSNI